eukprot:g27632.t1
MNLMVAATKSIEQKLEKRQEMVRSSQHEWWTYKFAHMTAWVVQILFSLASLLLLVLWIRHVHPEAYVVTFFVMVIAALAYLAKVTGMGDAVIGGRKVPIIRYIDWIATTPLMLFELCMIGGAEKHTFFMVIGCDLMMLTGGIVSAMIVPKKKVALKYLWFGSSVLFFCLMIAALQGDCVQVANLEDDVSKAIDTVKGTMGIAHTRWATHGKPSDINAHPHATTQSSIAVVHNGVIENHRALKEQLSGKGYQFISQTDTELLAHLVEDLKGQMGNASWLEADTVRQMRGGAFGLQAPRSGSVPSSSIGSEMREETQVTDHLQNAIEKIEKESMRYKQRVLKPWLDEEGQPRWWRSRICIARWVQSQSFETCMGFVIFVNIVLMIIETNSDAACFPDYSSNIEGCSHHSRNKHERTIKSERVGFRMRRRQSLRPRRQRESGGREYIRASLAEQASSSISSWLEPVEKVSTAMLRRGFEALTLATLVLGTSLLEDEKIKELMQQMTLDEKVGQLELLSRPWGDDFNGESAQWQETLQRRLINRELQRVAVEESRLGIPLIFAADVWHGMWTIFPAPLAEAASWEPHLAYETARASADPFLGEAFAVARVQGFQGNDTRANDSLASCLKHFAGYGGVLGGLDYSESDMSEATFREVFLPPFSAAIRAGALTIMSAFQALGGVPATGNRWLLTDVLRSELGFKGFVVTDAWIVQQRPRFAANQSDAARLALSAGVDMSMHSGAFRHLPDLVSNGSVSHERLDEAVLNVLRAKAAMGLFSNPYKTLDPSKEWPKGQGDKIEAHEQLARRAARKSLVLLKNENEILPLKKRGQRIAVIGWWANSTDTDGVGVIWGNKSHTVTLLQGLEAVLDSSQLRFVHGVDPSDASTLLHGLGKDSLAHAVAAARWADVVLLALGESSPMVGEAKSVTTLELPLGQRLLAEAVAKTKTPTVVLLKNGRALELEGAVRNASAIMVTWFLGTLGHAIADVLFGDYSPSGRLPISFPIKSGQQPLYYNHLSSGRPCIWGWGWNNCYRDAPGREALFSFGHGLTYSIVEYGSPWLDSPSMPWDGELGIFCNISNRGQRAAHEVVQLYVHDMVASRVRPVKELKGFQKIWLQAQETQTVRFRLKREQLAFATPPHSDSTMLYMVEPGKFLLWVAPSSAAGEPIEFHLAGPPRLI